MKALLTLALLSPLAVTALLAQEQALEVHDEWRLRKDEDGIQVYTRWIQASDTRKARQMRVEMMVNAMPEDVIFVIKDDNKAKQWVQRAKKHYHFDREDDANWYTYTEMSVPWPFSNRDLVVHNHLRWNDDRSAAFIQITGVPDRIPTVNSNKRIEHFNGSWTMERVAPGQLRVRYEIFTKSQPVLPRWIVDPIVEQGFWDTLSEMRKCIRNRTKTLARRSE